MKIWKVIFATLVIFAAGMMVGAAITRFQRCHFRPFLAAHEPANKNVALPVTNREPGRLLIPTGRPPFRNLSKDFLERLDRELQLEPEQRQQIETILQESQRTTREIWKKIEPEMREQKEKARSQIRETLNPEQAVRFEELMKRPAKPPKEGQSTNGAQHSSFETTNAVSPMLSQP